jgi:glycine/D-amino acid oxidase-like deaminating enzyme
MPEKTYDVVVVGGGIIGTLAAHALVERGARVALVERHHVGSGTTARSFAWINASSKVADEPYHRLNALGAAGYRRLAETYGDERLGLHRTGMLQCVNRRDGATHAAILEQARHLSSYNYPHRMIDADALAVLEPGLTFDADDLALHAFTEDWLDAPLFARTITDVLAASGAEVLEHCTARELAMAEDGAVTGVLTDAGMLHTEKVLIATGADTPDVLAGLTGYAAFAARFPMNRVPGLLVTTPEDGADGKLQHVIYFERASGAFHIRPAGRGALRLGADDTDGMITEDATNEEIHIAASRLLDRAKKRLPGLIDGVGPEQCALAIGVRPYPQDGKTLAGPLPGAEGLFLIATHSGITLAPALGDLMAGQILDGTLAQELRPFSLERFPGFAL